MEKPNGFNDFLSNINLIARCYAEVFEKFKKKENIFKNIQIVFSTSDYLLIIESTSTSTPLTITKFGLIAVPKVAGVGCGVAIGTELAGDL